MSKKIEQGEETKRQILETARLLFGKHGFQNTSTDDILASLNVTRGSLYHHFKTKKEIFQTLFLEYAHMDSARVRGKSWKDLNEICSEILDLSQDRAYMFIVMKDAHSVLSFEESISYDKDFLFKEVSKIIKDAIRTKKIRKVHINETVILLIGIVNQGLLYLSLVSKKQFPAAKKRYLQTYNLILKSLEI
jgi:AcrR family transcriptional regulator